MKLERTIQFLIKSFLFLLPCQTVWIIQERLLNGQKWQYGTIQFFATEAILWLIIVLFMFWYLKKYRSGKRERGFGLDRFFILSLFLAVLYAAVSRFWALDPALAVQYSLYTMEASCLFFIIAFGPVKFWDVLLWLVYGSILPALLGIVQFVLQATFASSLLGLTFHDPLVAGTSIVETGVGKRLLRAYGTFSHPNSFGGYLFFVCMAFVALYYFAAKEFDKKKSIVLSVAGVIVFHALFFTFSRSAWLAFLVLFACVSIYAIKNKNEILKKLCVRTLILMAIVLVAYHGYVFDRFTVRNTHEQASINERISGYKESWELFKKKPLFGVGVGNYTAASYAMDSSRSGWEYQPVHNVALLFLVEWGVVGGLLLAQVKILYVLTFRKYIRGQKAVIAVLVFSIAPLALFDHYLLSSYVGLVLLGIFAGLFTRYLVVEKSIHK